MQGPTKLKQYRTILYNKLKDIPDATNAEGEWERIKEAVTDEANEVIQTQTRTPRNEWWDEECRQYIKKKNEARSKWLQQKTRASQELCKKKRIGANVLIKQKKKAWMNNKILQIEYNQKKKSHTEILSKNQNFQTSANSITYNL